MKFKKIIQQILPPIIYTPLSWLYHKIKPTKTPEPDIVSNSLPSALFDEVQRAMDNGQFEFSDEVIHKLRSAWNFNPSSVPYPKVFISAMDDAISINSSEMNELSYRLPYSKFYQESTCEANRFIANQISQYSKITKRNAPKIADFGCGLGGCLSAMSELSKTAELHGFENSPTAVDFINGQQDQIIGHHIDLEKDHNYQNSKFPQLWGSFDLAICVAVLEHIPDTETAVTSIISCLRPGGLACLIVPDGRADTSQHHIHFWSKESWKLAIDKIVGFKQVTYDTIVERNMPGERYLIAIIKS